MVPAEGRIVVCVDPGKTVGIAALAVSDDDYLVEFYQVDWEDRQGRLKLYGMAGAADVLVVESFRPDHRTPYLKGQRLWAAEVIGALTAVCDLAPGEPEVVFVAPSTRAGVRAWLAQAVVGRPTGQSHAFDAAKLATWWLLRQQHPLAVKRAEEAAQRRGP